MSSIEDSTTQPEETKQQEDAEKMIEDHRKMKRPIKRAASPGLVEQESFTNFVSTKTVTGKTALQQPKLNLSSKN